MRKTGRIDGLARRFGGMLLAGLMMSIAGVSLAPSAAMAQGLKGQFGVGDYSKTKTYVEKLDFVISSTGDSAVLTGSFKCAKCTSGYYSNGSIRLMFIPVTGAHNLEWREVAAKTNAGEVVAMVINMDKETLPELGLAPGGVAYAWVGQIGANDERGFGIYRIDNTGKQVGSWWTTSDIKHCPDKQHYRPAIKKSHPASASVCNSIASGTPSGSVRLASTSRALFLASPGDGGSLWVSCTGGCCEVGGAK